MLAGPALLRRARGMSGRQRPSVASCGMDPATLRAEFPVLEQFAYLNAGTCGPLPAAAATADRRRARASAAEQGRSHAYFEAMLDAPRRACATAYAPLLGAATDDVALTTCTSEGIVRVLAALDLRPGDEVLTSDEEHPGLQGPLAAARDQRGIAIRAVPFAQIAERGRPADEARRLLARELGQRPRRARPVGDLGDVPVLLDGAQGIGAIATRRRARWAARSTPARARSGSAARSAAGMLWISPRWSDAPARAAARRT